MIDKELIKNELENLFDSNEFLEYLDSNKEYEQEIVDVLFKNQKENCWLIKNLIMDASEDNEIGKKVIEFIKKYEEYFYNLDYEQLLSRSCLSSGSKMAIILVSRLHSIFNDIFERTNILEILWKNFGFKILFKVSLKRLINTDKYILNVILKKHYNEFIDELVESFIDSTASYSEEIEFIENVKKYDEKLYNKIIFDITKEIIKQDDDYIYSEWFEKQQFENCEDFLKLFDKNAKNVMIIYKIIICNLDKHSNDLIKYLKKLDFEIVLEVAKKLFYFDDLEKVKKIICYACDNKLIKYYMENKEIIGKDISCCHDIINDLFAI
jgi:hypothetical protein